MLAGDSMRGSVDRLKVKTPKDGVALTFKIHSSNQKGDQMGTAGMKSA